MVANDVYYFKSGQTDARAQCRGDDFVILRDSRIWLRPLPRQLAYIQRERDGYRSEGYIDATGLVLKDIPLGSVSRAACFAHGAEVNVKHMQQAWRNERRERPPMRSRKSHGANTAQATQGPTTRLGTSMSSKSPARKQ